MNWFNIALGCAFLTACGDAASKRALRHNDEWVAGAAILGVSMLFLIPVFFLVDFQPVSRELVTVIAIALPLEILGYYLFLSAIGMAPLSLTLPLLAFTPVLTVLTSVLILGERISGWGTLGICMVTSGAYLLNADLANQGLLAPIRAIVTNPGSRRMFAVAVIWSVTTALGKKGITVYGAIPFGLVIMSAVALVFGAVGLVRFMNGPAHADLGKRSGLFLLIAGFFVAAAHIAHFVSLSMASVAYMISVKRLSMVFGVVLGWLFFGETQIRNRLAGALVMVGGVFFLQG